MTVFHLAALVLAVAMSAYPSSATVSCGCTCVPNVDGITFTPTAFIDDGTCGIPTPCESTALSAEVACYKCGQELNCVIDPTLDETSFNTIRDAILDDANGFCVIDENSKKSRTLCSQQNCDSRKVAPYGTKADCPDFTSTVCPVDTKFGLSNFATYTVSVGEGACPTCQATGECFGNSKLVCTAGDCVVNPAGIVCKSPKCDSGNPDKCSCEICESCPVAAR